MISSDLEGKFKGKYVEINYYDKEGQEVIVAGKLNDLKISMKDYSTCAFNPVVNHGENGYYLTRTKKNIVFFIPSGGLNKIEEKTRGEIILKCYQINEQNKNNPSDRVIIKGFQLLKDRKSLEETCDPSN